MLAPRSPIPESVWRQALGYGTSDAEQERFAVEVRNPCSRLLLIDGGVLKAPHESVLDWLSGEGPDSAIGMGLEELAVSVTPEHHAASAVVARASVLADEWLSRMDL